MSKSPLEAVLLSAAVPGLGQIYLDQVWKVPIIWGLVGGFLYGAVLQNGRYHDAQHSVDTSYADSNLFYAHQWESIREFYRDDRDKWIIYIGLAYIATILDAYIAANLYDFDVSDPAPARIGSYFDPVGHRVGMTLNLRF